MPIFLGKYIANPNKNCIRRHYSFIGIRYIAPTIINTFLEAHDFSGKKIILFATSGGSGFGETVKYLQPSAPDALIKEGKVFSSHSKNEAYIAWAHSL